MTARRPVALITGSARRLGAAIAIRLHDAGYNLALHYRESAKEVAELQNALEDRRRNSTVLLAADLNDIARLPSLVERTVLRFGHLDALVNNASAFFPTPVCETTEAMWDALMLSNAKAPYFLAQAAAFHLRQSHGAIVNLTDIYADQPLADHPVYCMSKAALSMMTKALAQELAPEVRVNAVAPGAILWPENGADTSHQAKLLNRTALGRKGEPDEVAEAVAFLLINANFTTGQTLRVDGGRGLSI